MGVRAPGAPAGRTETVEDRRETGRQYRYLSAVSNPSITYYAAAGAGVGAPLVLVLPGGGFRYVAIDKEGHEVARWLNTQGINAAVLKYRTADPEAERSWSVFTRLLALGDVGRALRTLRYHADTGEIDSNHIILPGFSAGATMAIQQTLDAGGGRPSAAYPIDRHSSIPNGVALIYSSLPDQCQPRILPGVPSFIVHGSADQKIPSSVASKLFNTITSKGGVAELHGFRGADHAFGVAPA